MKKAVFVFISPLLILLSCQEPVKENTVHSPGERLLMATLYSQQSAEADALYYQAYNIARIMVHNDLQLEIPGKKRAIITDIDETVLNNTPYQAMCIKEGISYPEGWDEWCHRATAEACPGSQQFLNYVAAQGIEVFYITNRKEHLREATLQNLKLRALPFADNEHLLMRTSTNSKEKRRKPIEEDYRVILLLGDNLDDFTNAFEERGVAERKDMAAKLKSSFGRRFIMFPNPMYGSWESALYGFKSDLPGEARSKARTDALVGY